MSNFLEDLFSNSQSVIKPMTQTVAVSIEKAVETPQEMVKESKEIQNEMIVTPSKLLSKPLTYTTLEFGVNLNLGNYSNGKVKVGIHYPVGVEFTKEFCERLDQSFNEAKKWIEGKLEAEVSELLRLKDRL